jgi:hypothetical protein
VLVFAIGELEIDGGFVADFQALQFGDAHVLLAALPDLALLKFHRRGKGCVFKLIGAWRHAPKHRS